MLPALRSVLTDVCVRMLREYYKNQKLTVQLIDYLLDYLSQRELVINFARECRQQKMSGNGNGFELHDVLSLIADFNIHYPILRYDYTWHCEIIQRIRQEEEEEKE